MGNAAIANGTGQEDDIVTTQNSPCFFDNGLSDSPFSTPKEFPKEEKEEEEHLREEFHEKNTPQEHNREESFFNRFFDAPTVCSLQAVFFKKKVASALDPQQYRFLRNQASYLLYCVFRC